MGNQVSNQNVIEWVLYNKQTMRMLDNIYLRILEKYDGNRAKLSHIIDMVRDDKDKEYCRHKMALVRLDFSAGITDYYLWPFMDALVYLNVAVIGVGVGKTRRAFVLILDLKPFIERLGPHLPDLHDRVQATDNSRAYGRRSPLEGKETPPDPVDQD